MKAEMTTFDKIQKYLFSDKSVSSKVLNEQELAILDRYTITFTHWYNHPELTDRQIQNFIIRNFKVSNTTSFYDVVQIKSLLGNIRLASKEYHRYLVVEMCKEAYQLAKNKNPPDIKGMVMAADKLGRYTRADQDETDDIAWDQIMPPNFEPTDNLSVLNITLDPDFESRMRKLKRKYISEVEDIEPEIIDGTD